MANDWSREEVEAIVADYFVMWRREIQALDYNKAEHNRSLQRILQNRSRSSIEDKHRNISAVLWHLECPYIDGYKPLPNYQKLLGEVVQDHLNRATDLNKLIAGQVRSPVKSAPDVDTLNGVQVPPPARKYVKSLVEDKSQRRLKMERRNFLEEESHNHSLGLAGELFIFQFEQDRLTKAGQRSLADRVEHVSQTTGDHLGFDILSFDADGKERLIEVKTTRYGALNRFFASANEVDVSHKRKDRYKLYRLFHFQNHGHRPQFFVLNGSLRDTCQLTPIIYSAIPN